VTALTEQDTRNVRAINPVVPELLRRQATLLKEDGDWQALKIGLIGSEAQLPILLALIQSRPVPVVLDPVLRAGGGRLLHADAATEALRAALFAHITVLTPNADEARRLTGCVALDAAGERLLATGVGHVLITGGDEPTEAVTNRWFQRDAPITVFEWPRLPGSFHGAGCTLAAAIAALLAQGLPVAAAIEQGQRFTQNALAHAVVAGRGRAIPWRRPPGADTRP
jgi:hydroxymethylpyrimidine/phosphomethylpyrimidine kinase